MTWTYDQASGVLSDGAGPVATGYSGHAAGRNNPDMESVANVGPIPRGQYTIGEPYDTTTHGPFVMRLTPVAGNDCCGRSGMLIHGDNAATHDASQGCIILTRAVREQVWESDDRNLTVL